MGPKTKTAKTTKTTTSHAQFEQMVEMLEQYPDIAKGFVRGSNIPVWNTIATELNSLGPPVRDGSGWKKVWFDFKANTKSKLTHNKKEAAATGGGPNTMIELTALESQVAVLTGLIAAVEGIGDTQSFGTAADHTSEARTSDRASDHSSDDDNGENQPPEPPQKKPKRSSLALLEKQVERQELYYTEMREETQKTNMILKDVLHEQCRHNTAMEKLCLEKLKVKKSILELELAHRQSHL